MISNFQSNNNLNFGTSFKLSAKKVVADMIKKSDTIYVKEMYEPSGVKLFKDQPAATEGILYCTGGFMKNKNERYGRLYHLYPDRLYGMIKGLKKKVKAFDAYNWPFVVAKCFNKPESKLFAIGGMSQKKFFNESLPREDFSVKRFVSPLKGLAVFNKFKRAINKTSENLDATIFYGQSLKYSPKWEKGMDKYPSSSFCYDPIKDVCHLNVRRVNEQGDICDVMTKKELKEHFAYINISPNDKVFIGDEQVPNEYLNHKPEF